MMEVGRKLPHDTPPDAPRPPLDQVEKARRARIRELADSTELGAFMRQLAKENEGSFDLVFADWISPPPGASFRDTTDK
jgi:hypothetical protein